MSTFTLKFVYNVFVDLYQKHRKENIYFSHNEKTKNQVIVSTPNPYFYKDIDSIDLEELSAYPFIASYGNIFYSSSNEMSTVGSIGKLARTSKIYVKIFQKTSTLV
ncbi:hypothetical protein [uncultured Clostridium sp.]|uniref:hypothetical protein n=1 Tax=uncultured Clostridium sp. TaxID=59620 RepID=UPI0028F117C7|nr:hypothetical protein [uncultured Clostridium sp.]